MAAFTKPLAPKVLGSFEKMNKYLVKREKDQTMHKHKLWKLG